MLIDTHAHLYWDSFKSDINEVIQRARDAGVTTVINVGVDVKKSKLALKQVLDELSKIPGFSAYSTIGIHPHEVLRLVSLAQDKPSDVDVSIHQDIEKLAQIYQKPSGKIVAVGECGLDYFFGEIEIATSGRMIDPPRNDEKELQRKLFQAQIDLAKKLNLPLIVHCRDDRSKSGGSTGPSATSSGPSGSPPQETSSPSAWDEVLKMVGTHPTILHCYSGLPKTTNLVLSSTNLLVSFAATITYPKNEYLREAAKILPLEKICLETDCPFLPPQSKRGQRNEPSAVLEIAQLIAEIKGASLEEVTSQTTQNVKSILRLT